MPAARLCLLLGGLQGELQMFSSSAMHLVLLTYVMLSVFIGCAAAVYAFVIIWIWLSDRGGASAIVLGWFPALLAAAIMLLLAAALWVPACTLLKARAAFQRAPRRSDGHSDVIEASYRLRGELRWRSPSRLQTRPAPRQTGKS